MSSRKQTHLKPAKLTAHDFGNVSVQRHNSMLGYAHNENPLRKLNFQPRTQPSYSVGTDQCTSRSHVTTRDVTTRQLVGSLPGAQLPTNIRFQFNTFCGYVCNQQELVTPSTGLHYHGTVFTKWKYFKNGAAVPEVA
jgi:hypothetical protein